MIIIIIIIDSRDMACLADLTLQTCVLCCVVFFVF